MKKRFMGLLMAFTLANCCILGGCGNAKSGDLLDQVKAKGKIVIAMEGQWAPWMYHDVSGELVGFDTEIGKAIAAKPGVEAGNQTLVGAVPASLFIVNLAIITEGTG